MADGVYRDRNNVHAVGRLPAGARVGFSGTAAGASADSNPVFPRGSARGLIKSSFPGLGGLEDSGERGIRLLADAGGQSNVTMLPALPRNMQQLVLLVHVVA